MTNAENTGQGQGVEGADDTRQQPQAGAGQTQPMQQQQDPETRDNDGEPNRGAPTADQQPTTPAPDQQQAAAPAGTADNVQPSDQDATGQRNT